MTTDGIYNRDNKNRARQVIPGGLVARRTSAMFQMVEGNELAAKHSLFSGLGRLRYQEHICPSARFRPETTIRHLPAGPLVADEFIEHIILKC